MMVVTMVVMPVMRMRRLRKCAAECAGGNHNYQKGL